MDKVWVIGGTSGIGQACADLLAHKGLTVHVTGEEEDVRSKAILSSFYRKYGPFDGVIYSAGINQLMWINEFDAASAADIMDVNAIGFMRLVNVVAHTECSSVVAVSSDAAVRPMRTSMAYCASKAALDAAVRCAARELAPAMRVNAVAPGMTDGTEMTDYIDEAVPRIRDWSPDQAHAYETSQIPMGRRANVAEIAQVVCGVLVGPDYLTGAIIPVNGGR